MGGSSWTQAIYDFLKHKIKKNFYLSIIFKHIIKKKKNNKFNYF
jgi:hypothetical protein